MANYGLTLVTPPTIEPVSLAEAKVQCGVADDVSYHDQNLLSLITAAREKVETDTGRAAITQTVDYTLDLLPCGLEPIYLPRSPVSSVTSLKYYDTSNVQQTLATTVYKTILDREPAEIRLKNSQQWPSLYGEPGVVTIRFVCGYAATAVPKSLQQAMLLLIGSWFENREAEQKGGMVTSAYDALISKWIVGDEFHAYGRSLQTA